MANSPKNARILPSFGQFSSRAILVATSIACVAAAHYGWRVRRDAELLRLVEAFNAAMDASEFGEAVQIAEHAVDQFPKSHVATFMLEKGRLAEKIMLGEPLPDDAFWCR